MIDFIRKPRYTLPDLIRLVHALRAPGGCPWDAAQTHQSIRRNFLEETYEACEALDCDDEAMLREELGDVLPQIRCFCRRNWATFCCRCCSTRTLRPTAAA